MHFSRNRKRPGCYFFELIFSNLECVTVPTKATLGDTFGPAECLQNWLSIGQGLILQRDSNKQNIFFLNINIQQGLSWEFETAVANH